MTPIEVASISLVLMLALIWSGVHVAVAMGAVSFLGVWLIRSDIQIAADMLAQASQDAISSHIFGVVPLFVLTGFLVAKADIGKDAFAVAEQYLRRLRGGLGVATVAANTVFAAMTGISIASAAVFTRIVTPEMIRYGYNKRFAVGVVAGSSVLGMLLPPSLLMILYAFLANVSVGDLFTAGILPGLFLALVYAVGIVLMATLRPSSVYQTTATLKPDQNPAQFMSIGEVIRKLFPSVLLISSVLGGLYAGFFTATEAGATGAAMALIIAIVRRKLTWTAFWEVMKETGHITVAVSFLIICANIYTRMLAMSGMPQFLIEWLSSMDLGVTGFLLIYLAIAIALGAIIDASSIILIMLPLMLPIAEALGVNLIWLGILTIVAVETGVITPPFGLAVFVIKSSLEDQSIQLGDIFRGAMPFLAMMTFALLVLVFFPEITLSLLNKP